MSTANALRPVALKKEGDQYLIIEWNDGHRSVYSWQHLRDHCPCAGCRDEQLQPQPLLPMLSDADLARPAEPLKPVAMTPIGHYAYKISWNDGHDLGIYSFEHLRELCQCEECLPAGEPKEETG